MAAHHLDGPSQRVDPFPRVITDFATSSDLQSFPKKTMAFQTVRGAGLMDGNSALLMGGTRRVLGTSVGGGESFAEHVQVASAIRSLLYGQSPGHSSGCTISKLSALSLKFFATPGIQPLLSILGWRAMASGAAMRSRMSRRAGDLPADSCE